MGRHAYGVPGLDPGESEKLLDWLVDFAVNDKTRVYYHCWNKGAVVVWDNRCLMHRACARNYREPRVVVHSRIAGDTATDSAQNWAASVWRNGRLMDPGHP